jgi:hypothetical protein
MVRSLTRHPFATFGPDGAAAIACMKRLKSDAAAPWKFWHGDLLLPGACSTPSKRIAMPLFNSWRIIRPQNFQKSTRFHLVEIHYSGQRVPGKPRPEARRPEKKLAPPDSKRYNNPKTPGFSARPGGMGGGGKGGKTAEGTIVHESGNNRQG